MKNILLKALIAAVAMLACHTATAQITDTIYNRYPRYHYTEWYDTTPEFYDTCRDFPPRMLMSVENQYTTWTTAKEHFSHDTIAVKGIAVMVSMNRGPNVDPYLVAQGTTRLPEYAMLGHYNLDSNTMTIISDSLRWDTNDPKIMRVELCYQQECCIHDCYVYEAYFTKAPVLVDSSFFIVATTNSNVAVRPNPARVLRPYKPTIYVGVTAESRPPDFGPAHMRELTYVEVTPGNFVWSLHSDPDLPFGVYFGGFFPIVDYYNLEARPEDSCVHMGTVTGSGRYTDNVARRITAVPAPRYRFLQWNDGNTENPRTVYLTQDTLFTAAFTIALPCRADALTEDSTRGIATGSGNYSQGDTVTFTAIPNTGYAFLNWSDGSTDNPYRFIITRDTAVTAIFRNLASYRVDATSSNHSWGFVTGGGTYWEMDTATLSATAREGYSFLHWNDGDTVNPRTIIVMQDTAFTAHFASPQGITAPDAKAPLFTLTPNPARSSVTVTINPQLPILNSQLSMTLTDAAGRELLNTKVSTLNFQLSLSQYPAGTYFVTLRTPDTSSTQRLVIK